MFFNVFLSISFYFQEFNVSTQTHDAEIKQLTQERDILANELSLINNTTTTLEDKIAQMTDEHEKLRVKCDKMSTEMEGKVSMAEHKEELEKLVKTKTKEIRIVINENVALKSQCKKMCAERDCIGVKIPSITSERARLKKKIKWLESEIKRTMPKLKEYLEKAEAACKHEAAYKRTLEECIKVAEKTAFDRNILAEIVRRGLMSTTTRTTTRTATKANRSKTTRNNDNNNNEEENVFNESSSWRYPFDKVHQVESRPPPPRRRLESNATTSTSCLSIEYGNPTCSDDILNLNMPFGDLWKTDSILSHHSNSGLHGNHGVHSNASRRGRKVEPSLSVPLDLEVFLEEQEKELDEMKEMIRLKQAYIEHLQTGSSI